MMKTKHREVQPEPVAAKVKPTKLLRCGTCNAPIPPETEPKPAWYDDDYETQIHNRVNMGLKGCPLRCDSYGDFCWFWRPGDATLDEED
jgi:hypothetical protein